MSYIVKQKINGRDYYYLRESKREGNKVISSHVAYLGKTKKEAEKKAREIIKSKKDKSSFMDEGKNKLVKKNITVEELARFCKEKGFVYRSSDIYGGFSGFWDFGPLGVELMNNLKQNWWNYFVKKKENVVGFEGSVISSPRTWKASGHIDNFNDVFVKCKKCGRTSKLDESEVGKVKCVDCGGEYESQGKFNLMFSTKVGAQNPIEAYMRGETAQGMFLDFKLIQQTSRMALPFGIAQVGRCFRNEIAPRDFLFRCREFSIAEIEFFINPEEKGCSLLDSEHRRIKFKFLDADAQDRGEESMRDVTLDDLINEKRLDEWHGYWLSEQILWLRNLGLEEIKIREHVKDELSHYSSATFDIDYEYPFGSREIAGNANRGQYDLTAHAKESKEKMEIFDEKYGNKIIPRVIEPTFGVERIFLALLTKAYSDDGRGNIVLNLPAKIAPVKAAIFPIVKKPEFEDFSVGVFNDLSEEWNVVYDKSGSIGRRYARNDEIGTPYCITIDEKSLVNKDVTIRDRNTTFQIRIKIKDLKNVLRDLIDGKIDFSSAGKIVK